MGTAAALGSAILWALTNLVLRGQVTTIGALLVVSGVILVAVPRRALHDEKQARRGRRR